MAQRLALAITFGVAALNVASGLALPLSHGTDDSMDVLRREVSIPSSTNGVAATRRDFRNNLVLRGENDSPDPRSKKKSKQRSTSNRLSSSNKPSDSGSTDSDSDESVSASDSGYEAASESSLTPEPGVSSGGTSRKGISGHTDSNQNRKPANYDASSGSDGLANMDG